MPEGRYTRIKSRFWIDEKVRAWDNDTRYLALYLLTSPHNNILGCYVLPKLYICGDIGWTIEQLEKPFAKLIEDGFIKYDEPNRLLLLTNYLKHNPIENGNQATAAIKQLEELPKSQLLQDLKLLLEQLNKPFLKPLLERIGDPVTVTASVTVTVTADSPPISPPEGDGGEEGPKTDSGSLTNDDYQEHSTGNDQCPKRHSDGDQCSKKRAEKKIKYAEFVSLTEEEYSSLVARLGSEARAKRCIEILDNYKGANGRRYRSDYRAILNWVIKRLEEEERKGYRIQRQVNIPRAFASLQEWAEGDTT